MTIYDNYMQFLDDFAKNYSRKYQSAVQRFKKEEDVDFPYYGSPICALDAPNPRWDDQDVTTYGGHEVEWLKYPYIDVRVGGDTWEEKLHVFVYAEIGGSEGGNCWGGRTKEYTKTTELNRDVFLMVYVQAVFETLGIPFTKEIKNQCRQKVKRSTVVKSEYYGNYYKYAVYRIALKDIFEIVM